MTKFISNDKELLMSIPEEQRQTGVKNKDLFEELPVEKALEMQWNISEDYFSFKIKRNQKLLTKRTMLSIISSIYDPLGFTSPFVLEGRKLLQRLCYQNVQCDEKISIKLKELWEKWESKLKMVEELHIQRCLQPI